jgi:hypothetical protein
MAAPAIPSVAFALDFGAAVALDDYLRISEAIPGWTRGAEARELAALSFSLPSDPLIVEIGSFLGSGTVLLAGPRRDRGSGIVHCIDSFDGQGDTLSVPYYREILAQLPSGSVRGHFEHNLSKCGLSSWVMIHEGRADEIALNWTTPIHLLFLDADQSPAGVRRIYDDWEPFLKVGGIMALHNSEPTNHRPEHDGHRIIVEEEIKEPKFRDIRLVDSTTFAVKVQ